MEKKEKQIFLLRHGDTGFGGRYIGSSDVPITAEGAQHLAALAPKISEMQFDLVLVSPLLRCQQSLEILGLTGEVSPLLREIDFGRWEKKSFAEVAVEDPELAVKWAEDADFAFPEGESMVSFRVRICQIAERLQRDEGYRVLVVTHGGVIRFLICHLLGIPVENYLLFDVAPGCLTELRLHSEGAVLRRFNCRG